MAEYRCKVCEFIYDEEKQDKKFSELPKDWLCPICGATKDHFELVK